MNKRKKFLTDLCRKHAESIGVKWDDLPDDIKDCWTLSMSRIEDEICSQFNTELQDEMMRLEEYNDQMYHCLQSAGYYWHEQKWCAPIESQDGLKILDFHEKVFVAAIGMLTFSGRQDFDSHVGVARNIALEAVRQYPGMKYDIQAEVMKLISE